MADKKQIDPQKMAVEAGLSQKQAVRALQYLIDSGWLFERHVNLDVGEGMGLADSGTADTSVRHYNYDSGGHLWVDMTTLSGCGSVALELPEADEESVSVGPGEITFDLSHAAVTRSAPPELFIRAEGEEGKD